MIIDEVEETETEIDTNPDTIKDDIAVVADPTPTKSIQT